MTRPTYIADDGDRVKSRAELVIDNFLTSNNIKHQYEKRITINGKTLSPDWFLPDCDAYIEFWGMESKRDYSERQLKKLKAYAESDLRVLSLNNPHLENGPLMAKTILGFIENIQKEIKVKEKLRQKEEERKIYEINRVRAEAVAKAKEKDRLHKIEREKKQQEIDRIKAKAEANQKKDESNEELMKLMETAITWTITGVKTGIDNLFKTKSKKAPRDKNCIYCHNSLLTSRHICTICQAKALTSNLCIFCGKATKKTKICVTCRSNSHHNCRLCRREITQPQRGKPVCDHCVLKIPFKRK